MYLHLPPSFFRELDVGEGAQKGKLNIELMTRVFQNLGDKSVCKIYWSDESDVGRITAVNAWKKARFFEKWLDPMDDEDKFVNGGECLNNYFLIDGTYFCDLMSRIADTKFGCTTILKF